MSARLVSTIDEVRWEFESSDLEAGPLLNYFAVTRRVLARKVFASPFVDLFEPSALMSLVRMVADRVGHTPLLALKQKGGQHWIISGGCMTELSLELPKSVSEFYLYLSSRPALRALISAQLENGLRSIEKFIRAAKFLREAGILGTSEKISRIVGPMSDYHDGGQCVLRCTFADHQTWFYKPRSVEVDQAWAQLSTLPGLRDLLAQPPLTIGSSEFGWQKMVANGLPNTTQECRRAVRGIGGLLALATLLQATDLHPENVAFGPTGPSLLDAETLLHPKGEVRHFRLNGKTSPVEWNDSLLRSHAFSCSLEGNRGYRIGWFDRCLGLGLKREPSFASNGTQIEWAETSILNPHADFWQCVDRILGCSWQQEVVHGFSSATSAIRRSRDAIDTALERIAAAPRRMIWRDTATWAQILSVSLEEQYLSSIGLRRAFLESNLPINLPAGLRESVADTLEAGDIPRLPSPTPSISSLIEDFILFEPTREDELRRLIGSESAEVKFSTSAPC